MADNRYITLSDKNKFQRESKLQLYLCTQYARISVVLVAYLHSLTLLIASTVMQNANSKNMQVLTYPFGCPEYLSHIMVTRFTGPHPSKCFPSSSAVAL